MKVRVTCRVEMTLDAKTFGEAEHEAKELLKPIVGNSGGVYPHTFENLSIRDD